MLRSRGIDGSCLRKGCHATFEEADAVARRINQEELAGLTALLIPYRCHFDPAHWHIGHVPWRSLHEHSGEPAMQRIGSKYRGRPCVCNR